MNRLSVALIAAVSTVAFTQVASAADMPMKAPVYKAPLAVPYSWTGLYVGVNAGWGWGDQTFNFSTNDPPGGLALLAGPVAPVSFNKSGAVGGFQLGYNWQFNQAWLVGVEADFDFSGINGSGNSASNILIPGGGFALMSSTASQRVDWFGTVRGRLGYLLTNNFLVYGTGGFAYGGVKQNANYTNLGGVGFSAGNGNGSCGFTFSPQVCYSGEAEHIGTGWTVGAGLEYALLNNFTLKAEYLYVNLGGNTFNENALVAGVTPPFSATSSFTAPNSNVAFQVVRVGLNYKLWPK